MNDVALIFNNFLLVLSFWFIYFTITWLAYYISEKCVKAFNYFDIIPFSCRKCLSTWGLGASYLSMSIIISNWIYFAFGLLITILNAVAMIYTEKEKMIE